MKKFFTLIAAALVAGSAFAQGEGFVNVIKNGDLNANDMTNFKSNDYWDDGTRHPESGNPVDARVLSDKGELCIIVQSNNNPSQEWDAQFFVTVPEDEAFESGTQIQLKMRVKADRAQTCGGQVHSAPGTYVQNLQFNVPSIKFTTGWDNYDSGVMTVKGDGTRTLAFNLADKNGTKLANTFYFDDIELWVKRPKPVIWTNLVHNGDCEGTNASSVICREYFLKDSGNYVDGVGVDGSRAAVVNTFAENIQVPEDTQPAYNQSWAAQFFVRISHKLAEGDKYLFRFSAKADKAASVATQAHGEPGAYIHYDMVGNVSIGTEWKDYEFKGSVTSQQKGMQTIAFNLQKVGEANVFYFDNIEFLIDEDILTDEEKEEAAAIANGEDEVATAINSAKVAKTAKAIYNVAGQQMKNLQKGLNIVEGKKIYVK